MAKYANQQKTLQKIGTETHINHKNHLRQYIYKPLIHRTHTSLQAFLNTLYKVLSLMKLHLGLSFQFSLYLVSF